MLKMCFINDKAIVDKVEYRKIIYFNIFDVRSCGLRSGSGNFFPAENFLALSKK